MPRKRAQTLVAAQYGDKGDFLKLTITLPPQIYELLVQEATSRKMGKKADPTISAIIREAVTAYLPLKDRG